VKIVVILHMNSNAMGLKKKCENCRVGVRVMVFNATLNNSFMCINQGER
jgi:hypothetical protein